MKILTEGAPELTRESEHLPSDYFTGVGAYYANALLDTMRKNNGMGLAAPQVGNNVRLFVMRDKRDEFICMNPFITAHAKSFDTDIEGCLSFPGIYVPIKRYSAVVVGYYDIHGKLVEETLEGKWGRCFQHELDHLNGNLFTLLANKIKLTKARVKAKKILKRRR